MKKQIDLHDLSQLSDTERRAYRDWWKSINPVKYGKIEDMDYEDMPLMTIGDMIDYLDKDNNYDENGYLVICYARSPEEACDELWKRVGVKLNELSKK